MRKEYISYVVIGIVAGIVLGFLVANWTGAGTGAAQQTVATNGASSESVNSSSSPELPPGHPPLDSAPTQAPPLPPGTGTEGTPSMPAAETSGSVVLPSLDPLPADSKEERAEQKYKNIQLLKGIPSDRLMKIMFAFKGSLGVDCTHCHIKDQWEKDDKPEKQMARKMIALVRTDNEKLGAARISCYTCHRGQVRPPQ